ncbi:MAG: hypothetical protein ACPHG7_01910 [Flavobacteriaceae bacterium]
MTLNRLSYNHQNGIYVSNALSYAWRVFFYINYFKISNAVLYCDDVIQVKIMQDAYENYFNSTYLNDIHAPIYLQKGRGNSAGSDSIYIPMEGDKVYELWRDHLNIPLEKMAKDRHITYSILSNSKDIKGLDDHCLETLFTCFAQARMHNLGDSRNFESSEHCLNKIKMLIHSSLYIGSDTSWNNIAPIFKIPVVLTVQEYPYMSDTVFKKNIVINRKTGHPIGYTPTT